MSETELHRGLTRSLTKALQGMFPDMPLSADLHDMPGQASTPNIGGFKPDVFGRCLRPNQCLVGEAKTTSHALQNRHSERQMQSFLSFLEAETESMFFLASPGELAGLARSTLGFLQSQSGSVNTRMFVFDSLDIWELTQRGGCSWRLH